MEEIKKELEITMKEVVEKMTRAFLRLNTGKANITVFDDIRVDYYGQPTPIRQMCNISIPEPKLVVIQPWDKTTLASIEKALLSSNIGITPENDGNVIRLPFPPLTQERRLEIVKQVKKMAEEAKISIRNRRRETNEQIKKRKKDGSFSEDEGKKNLKVVQEITDRWISEVSALCEKKQKELLTI